MRFLTIYRPADVRGMESGVPPTAEEMEAMGAFIGEMAQSGKLLMTDGLLPSSHGAKVRSSNGKLTVTEGPFTETKDLIGGFAIIEADTKQEAVELAKKFLRVAGDGESEVREMYPEPAYVSEKVRPSGVLAG